jgi:RNA polymerase sigma factor (sigma-70 family)
MNLEMAREADKPATDPALRDRAWASFYGDLRAYVAGRMRGGPDVEDVVHDIYRELLISPARDAVQNPRAWIWGIAWRVVHRALVNRRLRNNRTVTLDAETLEAVDNRQRLNVPASLDVGLEAAEELSTVLNGLPPTTQYVIIRSRRDGWSYRRIAAELGVSTNMVKKHVTTAVAYFTAHSVQQESQGP